MSAKDAGAQAETSTSIDYQSPFAQFYVNDPLYGTLFNRAIKNYITIGSNRESGVRVVPYGLNGLVNDLGDLSFTWSINGTEHPELSSNDSITLRAPENSDGSSDVSVDIHNAKEILQGISGNFSVKFKKSTDSQTNAVTF